MVTNILSFIITTYYLMSFKNKKIKNFFNHNLS